MGVLTNVLRFPLLSLATDTDTDREKYLPGDALLGRLDIESWEPDRLRSRASPEMPDGMEDGLRAVCILRRAGTEFKKKKNLTQRTTNAICLWIIHYTSITIEEVLTVSSPIVTHNTSHCFFSSWDKITVGTR